MPEADRLSEDPLVQRAKEVKAQVASDLRQYPNVTGVGVGYKVVQGQLTPIISIRVYVSRKLPPSALRPEGLLPSNVKGIPVDVIEGRFRIHQGIPLDPNPRIRRTLLQGGISIGNYQLGGSGTLGCSVFDNLSGEQMILSNWHVLCGDFHCAEGEIIVQPGTGGGDGGQPEDIVARLHRWALTDEVDCAIARLSGHRFLLPEILGLGRPASIPGSPVLGMHLQKSSRTSGVNDGMITDVSADVSVNGYPDGSHNFHNQIILEGNGEIDKPGDSGSVWIDDSNHVVALNFAGDSSHGIANPIAPVLQALDINLGIGVTLQDFTAMTASLP